MEVAAVACQQLIPYQLHRQSLHLVILQESVEQTAALEPLRHPFPLLVQQRVEINI